MACKTAAPNLPFKFFPKQNAKSARGELSQACMILLLRTRLYYKGDLGQILDQEGVGSPNLSYLIVKFPAYVTRFNLVSLLCVGVSLFLLTWQRGANGSTLPLCFAPTQLFSSRAMFMFTADSRQ